MEVSAQEAETRHNALSTDLYNAQVGGPAQGLAHTRAVRPCSPPQPRQPTAPPSRLPPLLQLEGERQDLQAALTSAEASLAELELDRRAAQAQARLAQAQRAEAEAAAGAAAQRAQRLEGELTGVRADREALRQELAGSSAGAAAQVEEARQEAASACALLATVQVEHKARQAQLSLQLQQAIQAAAFVERRLTQREREGQEQAGVTAELQGQLGALQAEAGRQAGLLAASQAERQGLAEELQAVKVGVGGRLAERGQRRREGKV